MGPDTQAKFGWEGLKNYKMIFLGQGMVGSIFWRILGWTIIWTIGATTLAIALGFILAIVLNNDRVKGKVLFRSIYLLPWAVPAFISILFFSILVADGGTVRNGGADGGVPPSGGIARNAWTQGKELDGFDVVPPLPRQ